MPPLAQSVLLFVIAGLCEIGGGWLVWQFWRGGRAWPFGVAGAVALLLYGIVPTYQPAHFGRVYAAYGGAFIALSLAWGWAVDRHRPDLPDVLGASVALVGMAIIMYWPQVTRCTMPNGVKKHVDVLHHIGSQPTALG